MRKNREFAWVFRKGKGVGGKYFTLVYLRARDQVHIGFSVSKKVGGAVVRNRVKRRLRECVRQEVERVPVGYRLIFVPKPEAATADFLQLRQAVRAQMQKAGAL